VFGWLAQRSDTKVIIDGHPATITISEVEQRVRNIDFVRARDNERDVEYILSVAGQVLVCLTSVILSLCAFRYHVFDVIGIQSYTEYASIAWFQRQ
jgi:hypothetical protein